VALIGRQAMRPTSETQRKAADVANTSSAPVRCSKPELTSRRTIAINPQRCKSSEADYSLKRTESALFTQLVLKAADG
jgi:hypothetical protein